MTNGTTNRWSASGNEFVCIDTMANVHLLDLSYFPDGVDASQAITIGGVNTAKPVVSLGTGTAMFNVKTRTGKELTIRLKSAHAIRNAGRNILAYSRLNESKGGLQLKSESRQLIMALPAPFAELEVAFSSHNGLFMTESWIPNSTRDAKGDHVVMILEVEGPTGLRPDPPRVSPGSREHHGRLSCDQTAAHVERATPALLEEADVTHGVREDGAGPTGLGLEPRLDEVRSDTPTARLRAGGGTGCATSLGPRLDVLSTHGAKTPPIGELLVAEELVASPMGTQRRPCRRGWAPSLPWRGQHSNQHQQ